MDLSTDQLQFSKEDLNANDNLLIVLDRQIKSLLTTINN
jgi:hypothetical protein